MSSILQNSISNYPNLNWELLAKAKKYYTRKKYEYIETPWIVPLEYNKKTKPHNDESFVLEKDFFKNQKNELVGSAEQGFIYLILNEKIKSGKYCSISPCFRADNYDEYHQPWFMKLEIIDLEKVNEKNLFKTINNARQFFTQMSKNNVEIIQTGNYEYDLYLNNIEIGSYGIRKINNFEFIYGTGLALPRFDYALSQ